MEYFNEVISRTDLFHFAFFEIVFHRVAQSVHFFSLEENGGKQD